MAHRGCALSHADNLVHQQNVFMLPHDEEVAKAVGAEGKGPVEVMARLRQLKNDGKMMANI